MRCPSTSPPRSGSSPAPGRRRASRPGRAWCRARSRRSCPGGTRPRCRCRARRAGPTAIRTAPARSSAVRSRPAGRPPPVRSTLGSKSNTRVIALSANATSENDMTKPSAIIAGRALPVWPTDAPSRIGSIGSVQGAATVTTPASSARTRLNIGPVHQRPRQRRVATAGSLMFFAMTGRAVTPPPRRVTSL